MRRKTARLATNFRIAATFLSNMPENYSSFATWGVAQQMLSGTDPMAALANLEEKGLVLDSSVWTESDTAAAFDEGWNLFDNDVVQEIQRDDEAGVFSSDEDAIGFVKKSTSLHAIKDRGIVGC